MAPSGPAKNVSEATLRDAALSHAELWLRYFELGGMRTPAEVASSLRSAVASSAHDHDVLAQALNERFSELGQSRAVHYAEAGQRPTSSPQAGGAVQLGLLGSFSLRVDGRPVHVARNARRLVCFLALNDGWLLRRHIAGSLWGDTTERRAAGSLRSALWRLGRSTAEVVEVAESHLRLSPSVVVDIRASEAAAHRVLNGSPDLSDGDLDGALLSADLLPDWTEDWVLINREYHAQLRLRALDALCRRLSDMGRFGEAVQVGLLAVCGEPLRESAQRSLVTVHLAEGNVAAALKQYDSFRDLLRQELELDPSPQMQALITGLRR